MRREDQYYDDPISKDTKPAPDRNALYRCEHLIMLDGKLFGVFSNDSGNYSVQIGDIRSYLNKNGRTNEEAIYSGAYCFHKDGELYHIHDGRMGKSDATFSYDGYIKGGASQLFLNHSWTRRKNLKKI